MRTTTTFAVAVFLAVFTIAVHSELLPVVREQGRICSRWVASNSKRVYRSIADHDECAGKISLERRSSHVRACCSTSPFTRAESAFPTECGKQQYEPFRKRIVGGTHARPNSWPWLVHLEADGSLCGGSLIDTQHVLTAAHCITNANEPDKYTVNIGRHDINEPVREEHAIVAEQIFVHEDYNAETYENDVALIRLRKAVQISEIVNVICMPGPEATSPNETVWVAGWGTVESGGQISVVLKQAALHTMPGVCETIYRGYDSAKQMCAGAHGGGHDTCQGDSGGPLMYESEGTWYLNGVVSFGKGCAVEGYPGVYARVSYYLPWIRSKMG